MSVTFKFGNDIVRQPDVYARTENRIQSAPIPLAAGGITIIDTGSGASFFSGSGIAGQNAQDQKSVYSFNNIQDFQSFTRGGLWWDLANPLFIPNNGADDGVSTIEFVRAAATTAATNIYTFTGGGPNGGTLTFTTLDEGTAANGVLGATSGTELIKGYAAQMIEAPNDPGKYQIQFYIGTFLGNDPDGDPYGGLDEDNSPAQLITTSDPFSSISEFTAWAQGSVDFKQTFILEAVEAGDGSVDSADFLANQAISLFAGGTETYSSAHLDTALENLKNSRSSFVFANNFALNAKSANNIKVVTFGSNTARFKKQVYIAGGNDASEWSVVNGTLDIAQTYNNDKVTVVHGAPGFNLANGDKKVKGSEYKAALALGREAGLPAQVPLTNKNLSYDFEVDPLSPNRIEQGVQGGVMVTNFDEDFNAFVVNEGVNSLQNNLTFFSGDKSYNKQITRIQIELNKGIVVNGKQKFFAQPDGTNRNTVSSEDVQSWLNGYLQSLIARKDADNLLTAFRNVVVTAELGAYRVSYEFEPNFEVKIIMVTGFLTSIIDNLAA